jgi:transposase
MPFARAYPRESQEMVFAGHDRAFRFFGGACRRGIYDNMKTAVDAVFVGKERRFNRRFEQMCGHYLVEPTACTPGAGWEKGQVENQVGTMRERLFTPPLRFESAYSDEFERRFQSIVNAGSDDFERAGVRRWWWFSFHFGSVRSRGRSSP